MHAVCLSTAIYMRAVCTGKFLRLILCPFARLASHTWPAGTKSSVRRCEGCSSSTTTQQGKSVNVCGPTTAPVCDRRRLWLASLPVSAPASLSTHPPTAHSDCLIPACPLTINACSGCCNHGLPRLQTSHGVARPQQPLLISHVRATLQTTSPKQKEPISLVRPVPLPRRLAALMGLLIGASVAHSIQTRGSLSGWHAYTVHSSCTTPSGIVRR